MLETRKVLTAVIGYILGILMGLYCKISIVLFYIIIYLVYLIFANKNRKRKFKLFSFKRYFRYLKVLFNKEVIKIIVIFGVISNTIVLFQNYKYENLYKNLDGENCNLQGIVLEIFDDKAKVKIINSKYKNTYLYIYSKEISMEYGDKIAFEGKFSQPEKHSNYKGFDRFEYYKTLKTYGTVKCKNVKVLSKNNGNIIRKSTFFLVSNIKHRIEKSNLENDEKALLEGILLGDKSGISENLKENFSESNISHILAVSGMHVAYIILVMNFAFNKLIGKHYSKLASSIVIVIYMGMANFTPSIVRAGITGIIALMSNFVYRRNDIWESLSISLLVILVDNPFAIKDIGLELSFGATIGIIVLGRTLKKFYEIWLERTNRRAVRRKKKFKILVLGILGSKIGEFVTDAVIVTVSAMVAIMPIMVINLNTIAITSLIISVVSSFLIGPIMIIGIIYIFIPIGQVEMLMNIFIKLLIMCSNVGSNLPLNQIYLVTPKVVEIIIYYLVIWGANIVVALNLEKNPSIFEQRIIDVSRFIKYKLKSNYKKIISFILIICVLNLFYLNIPKDLKIYFVDVGQGDCSLIVTPNNKTILIDGGGSSEFSKSNFNVGKSVLMPYLLDRQIAVIDYVIFSHMDSDHAQGLLYIMENMKVKNAIIGKQYESSGNYEKFIKIAKERKINVKVVEVGSKINVGSGVYFNVLWPSSSNMISENAINNNSLVCKLVYKNFSMLFTGDIEEVAEKEILKFYKNNPKVLEAKVLKVAHHGSKTSSSVEFLNVVKPKFALIGVGKNNNFGHPAEITLEKLRGVNCKVYRTDEAGEIEIRSNGMEIFEMGTVPFAKINNCD